MSEQEERNLINIEKDIHHRTRTENDERMNEESSSTIMEGRYINISLVSTI